MVFFSLLYLCYQAAIKTKIILLEVTLRLAIVYEEKLDLHSRKERLGESVTSF